jgi:predicted Rdx family selenoprotein
MSMSMSMSVCGELVDVGRCRNCNWHAQGDMMSFTIVQGDKGAKAANVTVMPGADGSQTFIGEVKSYNAMKALGA